MLDFQTTVRSRQSIRSYLPKTISDTDLQEILIDAQSAPSACNTQPWEVHIVSGDTLKRISQAMLSAFEKGEFNADVPFDQNLFGGKYEQRWREQYKFVFDSFGVIREDKEGRSRLTLKNFEFYGAPHACFLFMPKVADSVAVANDIGMYAQNFLLSLTARGFGGIPMLTLGMFAKQVKEILGVPDDMQLLYGISFGYPDWDAQPNKEHLGRIPVSESVTIHR
ncbi:nitroreductase [Pasteurellaceae bacterium LFhippo2]|nr:nitroreductase [Pasteurellaceae bacterium LFhippo2]